MTELVTLDGFHAVKHAVRFGADIVDIVAVGTAWQEMAATLASDVAAELEGRVRIVETVEFERVSPRRHPTGIAAVARRPSYAVNPAADTARTAPAILLENPRRLGNVGAVIRVAAAVGAASVLTTGEADPWQTDAIRGSAGLHFALPVARISSLNKVMGPIVAMDAGGTSIEGYELPTGAIIAFGTERDGVSDDIKRRADAIVSLPMRPGVSSLNLATTVAASLYYWSLKDAFKPK